MGKVFEESPIEVVSISKERYEHLLEREKYADALDAGGVDNWDWYSDSLKEHGYWDEE